MVRLQTLVAREGPTKGWVDINSGMGIGIMSQETHPLVEALEYATLAAIGGEIVIDDRDSEPGGHRRGRALGLSISIDATPRLACVRVVLARRMRPLATHGSNFQDPP
jgi:hypothetical protein